MSDLVGNPEDRFSRITAHIMKAPADYLVKCARCHHSLERSAVTKSPRQFNIETNSFVTRKQITK